MEIEGQEESEDWGPVDRLQPSVADPAVCSFGELIRGTFSLTLDDSEPLHLRPGHNDPLLNPAQLPGLQLLLEAALYKANVEALGRNTPPNVANRVTGHR